MTSQQSQKELFKKYPHLIFYLVLLVVILVGGAMLYSAQSSFCGSCHEMQGDYHAWQKSAHSRIDCVKCHIPPGATSFILHKLSALREVALHLSRTYPKVINEGSELSEEMESGVCVDVCHAPPGRQESQGVIINHAPHEKKKLTCPYCHNRVAHSSLDEYASRITMQFCFECHDGKQAPRGCKVCHTPEFKLTPDSHDKGWRKRHGKEGKEDLESCYFCHYSKKFCNDCHRLPMPHPPSWEKIHKNETKLFPLCGKCHTDPYYCEKCHHEGYNPPQEKWLKKHGGVVKRKGKSRCLFCHTTSHCERCHLGL